MFISEPQVDIRRTTVFGDAHEVVHHQLVGLLKARGAQICPAVFSSPGQTWGTPAAEFR